MEGGIKEGGDESVKMVSRAARGKFPSLTLRPLLDYKGERIEYSPQASVSSIGTLKQDVSVNPILEQ